MSVQIGVGLSLVGMRAVHQPLGGERSEYPGQFRYLSNIRLPVENRPLGIQTGSQPGRRDFEAGTRHFLGIAVLDQRVQVSQEEEAASAGGVAAGLDRRPYSAHVIAQVRSAGGGDAGQRNEFFVVHE